MSPADRIEKMFLSNGALQAVKPGLDCRLLVAERLLMVSLLLPDSELQEKLSFADTLNQTVT